MTDDTLLDAAISEARQGLLEGGIPIDSVLVHGGKIIGRGHNRRVRLYCIAEGMSMVANKKPAPNPPETPRVGIFWLFGGKLVIDSTLLSEAERDGDNLGHATAHIDHWTSLQESGILPIEVEYDDPPRGRVGYSVKKKKFWMLADECIISDAGAVQRIIAALHLPASTEPMGDSDYRCAQCLSRTRRRGDQ